MAIREPTTHHASSRVRGGRHARANSVRRRSQAWLGVPARVAGAAGGQTPSHRDDSTHDRHSGRACDDTKGQTGDVVGPPPVQAPQHRLSPERHPRPDGHTARTRGRIDAPDRRCDLDDVGDREERPVRSIPKRQRWRSTSRPSPSRRAERVGQGPGLQHHDGEHPVDRGHHHGLRHGQPQSLVHRVADHASSLPTPTATEETESPAVSRDVSSRRSCGNAPTVASTVATTAAISGLLSPSPSVLREAPGGSVITPRVFDVCRGGVVPVRDRQRLFVHAGRHVHHRRVGGSPTRGGPPVFLGCLTNASKTYRVRRWRLG